MKTATVTAADYQAAFEAERVKTYPAVDAFEAECGYAIDRAKLEAAARVLACPVKRNPPNWQHGRVLYAAARQYFAAANWHMVALDIGTAKGFSALCLQWAMDDAGRYGQVTSVDVIPPASTDPRNTVAELDSPKTLRQILAPWPETERIDFFESTGIAWLEASRERVHVAFVDGKHAGHVVRREGVLLASRQASGDLAIFDDVHIPDVSFAVTSLHHEYKLRYLDILPNRHYAIGVRR